MTHFKKGDLVRANTTVQGLVKDTIYIVCESEERLSPWGNYAAPS